jgi:hypothetical protein
MSDPIIIDPNSIPGQLWALFRYLLTAVGSFALGRGYIDDALLQFLTALFTVAAPTAYGIYKTWANRKKLVKVGEAAPDTVAVVK